jgi:hypothetical protein
MVGENIFCRRAFDPSQMDAADQRFDESPLSVGS